MNVRPDVVCARVRMLRIARHVYEGGELTSAWIVSTFGVVSAVARADMRLAGMYLRVEIGHGPFPDSGGTRPKRLWLAR